MGCIEIRFLGGRFHATPWGRNVNEGEVEWPPSPFRLARALMDIRYRQHPDWTDERFGKAIQVLSGPLRIQLPPASTGHLRAFLHSNESDATKRQKVFDAFVVVNPTDAVHIELNQEGQSPEAQADLQELLDGLGYLGRSESWIEARVVDKPSIGWNCCPVLPGLKVIAGEGVLVAGLSTPSSTTTSDLVQWVKAIGMSTDELLAAGWSQPPALAWASYIRPERALKAKTASRAVRPTPAFRVAQFALQSTVLPRVTETIVFADRIRTKLMGIHRRVMGGDPTLGSLAFSGKDASGNPAKGHQHLFVVPLDMDGDGRIDHVEVRVPQAFSATELQVLDRLSSVWQSDGRPDVAFALTSMLAAPAPQMSRSWISTTPFLTSRHYRQGRGEYFEWLALEVARECKFHGLPKPSEIEWIESTRSAHPLRWMEFRRNRKDQTPLRGHGCILHFEEEVGGPFVLGALCHFGMGLFQPA
jgi:CRISPR-associated protein Csb2